MQKYEDNSNQHILFVMSYSRRSSFQEYDIGVEFWEAPLEVGHRQIGDDDEETLAVVVLAAVEAGEREALEFEIHQLVHHLHPQHSLAGVAAEDDVDGRVGIVAALLDFDGQFGELHGLAHTECVEDGHNFPTDAEGVAHHLVGVAHHQQREAVLRKAVVDVADDTARTGGVFDCLIEDVQKLVFCVIFHIVSHLFPTMLIRRAPNVILFDAS